MNRTQIILGGATIIALDTITKVFDITYTDVTFWYVLAPIAFVAGIFIRHTCK